MSRNYGTVRNLRRMAERRINALKKQHDSASSSTYREKIQRDITRVQEAMESTRMYSTKTGKRIRNESQVAHGIDILRNIIDSFPLRGTKKRNRSFAMRLNMAGSKSFQGPTRNSERTLGEEMAGITRAQVKVFFRATQKAWDRPDVPVEHRLEAIIEHYRGDTGTTDLQQIFDYVMSNQRNADVAKAKDIVANPDKYTDGEKEWAYDVLADNDAEVRYEPTVTAAAVSDVSPVAPM